MKKILNRTLAMIMSATMVLSQALPTAAEESASTALSIEEVVEEKTETEAEDKASKETSNENVPLDEQPKDEQEVSEDDSKDEATKQDSKEEKEASEASEHTEEKSDDKSNEDAEEKEEAASDIEISLLEMPQEQSEYILEQYGEDVLNTYDITVPEGTEFPVQITFSADVSDDQAVILFHYTGDEWEEITPDEVDEGSITATFGSLSPVAVVDVAEEDDAEGAEITAEYKVNNEDAGYIEDNTAIANEYYEFVNWTSEDGEEVSAEAYFVAENDGVYTANFKAVTYTIEYKAADGGTVSAESEEATIESGVTGAVAEAGEGYLFVNWTDEDENVVSEDAELVPELKDGIYTANFKEEGYVVTYKTMLTEDSTVPEDGLFGTAFVNATEETEERSKDVFAGATATASDGYRFVNWVDADGNEVSNKFTFIPSEVTEDAIYTAVFESTFVNTELSAEAGEQTITATGPMPRGAELVAEKITYVKPVEETVNGSLIDQVQFTALHAFDIKIMADGEEWQPIDDDTKVTISIEGTRISEIEEDNSVKVKVYRIEEDNENTTDMSATTEGDTVTFETEHFTVYTVGSSTYNTTNANQTFALGSNITAYWYESDGVLIIVGSGNMGDTTATKWTTKTTAPLRSIIESIKTVEFVNTSTGITSIGRYLFADASSLTEITLPTTLRTIETYAFSKAGLTSIDLSHLTNLTAIEASAFSNCYYLIDINISGLSATIGGLAFTGCATGTDSGAEIKAQNCVGLTMLTVFNSARIRSIDLTGTSITAITDRFFYTNKSEGYLTEIHLPEGVTEISNQLFYNCSNLQIVEVTSTSVTTIGSSAFKGCNSLTTGLTFKNCEQGEFPNTITTIGDNAFDSTKIKIKKLPNSLESIGNYAFNKCSGLELTKLPNTLKIIGNYAFDSSNLAITYLPDSITSIGDAAFRLCKNMAIWKMPDSIATIGAAAFSGCGTTDEIFFSQCSNLKTIGSQAFNATGITNLDLRGCTALESIGSYAFIACHSLTNVQIKALPNLTTIGQAAFADDEALYVVTIDDCPGLISISANVFGGYSASTLKNISTDFHIQITNCPALTNIDNILLYRYNVVSFSLKGTGVASVGKNAFGGDGTTNSPRRIEFITLPETLSGIEQYAFDNCPYLSSITIPASVITIGTCAFRNCPNLTTIKASGNATVGASAFKPVSYAPSGADPKGNYYLDGEYHEVTLPLKTTLIGDADWFDTYDWKSDYRLIGDYTVTLPMSIDLEYDGESFGNASYSVDNNTNDWPVVVTPWDSDSAYTSGKITLKDTEGNTLVLRSSDITYSTDYTTDAQIFETGENEKVITFTPQTTPTKEASYTGELTFKTAIKVG